MLDIRSLIAEFSSFRKPRVLIVALLAALLPALPQTTFAASGQAVFVRGNVVLVHANGSREALQPGQPIAAGQSLEVGADGYAHLRFADGGFVGLRPGARFKLEEYATDPDAPGGVRVRYRLDEGVVRAITGKAIEQNKDRFRLNTPVAAVGVRGTDYIVQTTAEVTRASVSRGEIVLAPLGGGCEAGALGVCNTAAARALTADSAGVYLEYRSGTAAPVLQKSPVPGFPATPPEEPSASGSKQAQPVAASSAQPVAVSSAQSVPVSVEATAVAPANTAALESSAAATATRLEAVAASVVAALPPPPRPEVVWGRWSTIATATPLVTEQIAQGYRPSFSSPMFGLLVGQDPGALPREGVVGFNLTGSEAYVRSAGAGAVSPVQVSSANLTIDFAARRFDTGLAVSGAGVNSNFSATGKVDWQGAMISDASRSTMSVLGALAGPAARDAGYLFSAPLAAGASLYGATSWRR